MNGKQPVEQRGVTAMKKDRGAWAISGAGRR
jgi:hypothetical protein